MEILIFAAACIAYNGVYLAYLIRKRSVRGAIGTCAMMTAAAALMILNIAGK
jgi:hypothetical protein